MTQYHQMTKCCGILINHSFEKLADPISNSHMSDSVKKATGHTDDYVKHYNKNHAETLEQWPKRILEYLKRHIKELKGDKSYTLAALNKEENDYLGQAFLDAGFEVLVPMMKNPSGTEIILYVHYHIQKPWEEKKVVRKSIIKKAS